MGIGAGALNGAADSPDVGGLTPLAPQGATESGSGDQVLFVDDEPETPFVDGPGTEVLDGSGMVVPGFDGDVEDTVVEAGSGMVVPGYQGLVTGYRGDPGMYGPKFNSDTRNVYQAEDDALQNSIVGG